jgi:hypothetical protein
MFSLSENEKKSQKATRFVSRPWAMALPTKAASGVLLFLIKK